MTTPVSPGIAARVLASLGEEHDHRAIGARVRPYRCDVCAGVADAADDYCFGCGRIVCMACIDAGHDHRVGA